MTKNKLYAIAFLALSSQPVFAQEVTESWMRTAGALCQGRFSAEVAAKGELQITKWFSLVDPGAEGEAKMSLTDLNRLLGEFTGNSKDMALAGYYKCLEGFLIAGTSSRTVQPGDLVLAPGTVPSGIKVVPNQNKFVMKKSDTIGLLNLDRLLTFVGKGNYTAYTPYFRISSTTEGVAKGFVLRQGETYKTGNCVITLYDLTPEKEIVSLILRCNDK